MLNLFQKIICLFQIFQIELILTRHRYVYSDLIVSYFMYLLFN